MCIRDSASTSLMASFRAVLPFFMEIPMLMSSSLTWKSLSPPPKSSRVKSDVYKRQALVLATLCVFLKVTGRNNKMIFPPLIIMLLSLIHI